MLGVRTRAASAAPLKRLLAAAVARSARDASGAFVERFLAKMAAPNGHCPNSFLGRDGRVNLQATLLDLLSAGRSLYLIVPFFLFQ